jgi:DNA-binding transcriptional MerR regulator
MNSDKPYLSTNEIAKMFNVKAITIRRWEKKGIIKSYRLNPKGKNFL